MSRRSPGRPPKPEEILQKLKSLGVRPDRRSGQSFLSDPFVADAEAALVGAKPPGPVLEVGGGLGVLTEALLRREIGPLTVVEPDHRLADHLHRTFGDRITIVEQDALTYPIPNIRAAVGNLPYSVATPILLRLFQAEGPAGRRDGAAGGRRPTYGELRLARLRTPDDPGEAVSVRSNRYQVVPARRSSRSRPSKARSSVFSARAEPVPSSRSRPSRRCSRRSSPHVASSWATSCRGSPRMPSGSRRRPAGRPEWPTRRPEDLPPEGFFGLANALTARASTQRRAHAPRHPALGFFP